MYVCRWVLVFFFKQKTAYEMRISDLSSDVCSSDLLRDGAAVVVEDQCKVVRQQHAQRIAEKNGRGQGRDGGRGMMLPALQFAAQVGQRHARAAFVAGDEVGQAHDPASAQAVRQQRQGGRSEERRAGKECGSTCRSGGLRYHYKKKKKHAQED